MWQSWCQERGWQFLSPWDELPAGNIDNRAKALVAKVEEASKQPTVDGTRIYLAGQGDAAAAVFYLASRIPDLWAAAIATGGSARSAIDGNRLFAANTTNLPVLWLFAGAEQGEIARKLQAAGFHLEFREETLAKPAEIFDWLAAHQREPFPVTADCETGSPLFTHCYWVEVTKFDPAERNDVLDSTRIQPLGSNASLELGRFGYDPAGKGPGVEVIKLPDNYHGPLKLHDRIIAVSGKQVVDSEQYAKNMYLTFEEKPTVVMIERGKEHLRLETRIVQAPREEPVTARVQGRYLPESHEVQIISRDVAEMKVTLPEAWLPAKVNWNGVEVAAADAAGCWLLQEDKELLSAKRCQ